MLGVIRDVVRVLRMPCREHAALFSRQLDEPLRPGLAIGLRVHVLYCVGCRRFRAQIHRLRDLARLIERDDHAGEPMPDSVRVRVLGRVTGDHQNL